MRRTIACLTIALALPGAGPVSLSALCAKSKEGEIVVCADPDPPPSKYRLPGPPPPPEFGTRASVSVNRERAALFDYDAGGSGLCSSVGPGGAYGCAFKQHKAATEQRSGARSKRGYLYDTPY